MSLCLMTVYDTFLSKLNGPLECSATDGASSYAPEFPVFSVRASFSSMLSSPDIYTVLGGPRMISQECSRT